MKFTLFVSVGGERKQELRVWNFKRLLAGKYDVVVTNPPYMGSSGMDAKLAKFMKENHPNSKSDASTAFMEQSLSLCKPTGFMAVINIPVWMFLSSYEKLRFNIIQQTTIINMLHFGRGVFGSDFGTTSFVIAKTHFADFKGTYRRLFLKQGAVDNVEQKEKWFFLHTSFTIALCFVISCVNRIIHYLAPPYKRPSGMHKMVFFS
jgi:type I restriction-modification system DNA methylase subunit